MNTPHQQSYVKHAWLIFFGLGLLAVVAGLAIVAGFVPNPPSAESTTGLTLEQIAIRIPGFDNYVAGLSRQLGNFMIGWGVLLLGIAAYPYRSGERWAWYVCWIVPLNLAIQLANSFATGGFLWQVDLVTLVVVVAGLLLPVRTFFPASPKQASR